MERNIIIENSMETPIETQRIELVERKGIGHPDSIADGLAESISQALCHEYKKEFGYVLHHNTDETQIVAGRSKPNFKGGQVIQPIYILLVGRATKKYNNIEIPTDTIALNTARKYLSEHLENLDIDSNIILDCKFGSGSSDLTNVFSDINPKTYIPSSNDTSFGVGHAPFSDLENIVYNTERYMINILKKKKNMKFIGEDIKVMGLRNNNNINLTICSGFIDKYVDDIDTYINYKEELVELIYDFITKMTSRDINIQLNTADNIVKKSVYLTVTGTSAEMGDDGSVGRGNRSNGLITPNRPMSMEATSGKNPINHIGKIYNLLSTHIAKKVINEVEEVDNIYIKLLSEIGKPIDQPLVASAQIIKKTGSNFNKISSNVEQIINEELKNIHKFTNDICNGKFNTF